MTFKFLDMSRILFASITFALATSALHAAPYGDEGMPIEWTQPDGSKLSLRVFGDEFYARTETADGYTVVYNPATQSYEYATRSKNGQKLVPNGQRASAKTFARLPKRLKPTPDAVRAIWEARHARLVPNERADWVERVKAAHNRKAPQINKSAPQNGPGDGNAGIEASAPAFAPVTGGYVGLTILVQFPDDSATVTNDPTNFPTTKANVENFCNQIGYTGSGNTGSVRDYFKAQSLNQMDYTQVVTEIVTLPQPRAYYNWSDYPTNKKLRDGGLTGRLVLGNAITILKNQGFDFSGLTLNGSKRVIATNVVFAGNTSGVWPDGLWPHRWTMSPVISVGTTAAPIYIYDYQITNAANANIPIGTFCHENGHLLLKYPDLYDYDQDSEGVGNHCLMAAANNLNVGRTPGPINGYFKAVSGWSNVVDITASQAFTASLTSTNNQGYRIRKPGTSKEYFLIENRGAGDPWAQSSPDKGILVWHIDEDVNGNSSQQMTESLHYEVSLEQSDGAFDLEKNRDRGDNTDAFDNGNTLGFSDHTTPDAKWWDGTASGIRMAFLSAPGASMDVRFGLPANTLELIFPNGGHPVVLGSTSTIAWAANIAGNVKIELFKGGSFYSVLSPNEVNDGSYLWTVSSGLPVGDDYTVKISSVDNPTFSDTSDSAFSVIVQPSLADALDTTELAWITSGDAPWFPQVSTTKDGTDAAESGTIANNQTSNMETTLIGPGSLTFWWKVSSEENYDFLRFYIKNIEQTGSLARISGEVDWVKKTVSIPAGNQTVKWSYTKDGVASYNSDTAWVDQVIYAPASAPEIVVEQPVGSNLVDGSASVSCGLVNVGSASAAISFTIRNAGTSNLTGLAVSKDGANSSDYTIGSLGVTTLAPGSSTTFPVTFSPSIAGSRSAVIHILSNDADENPFDIMLTGIGIGPGTLAVISAGGFITSGTYGGPFSPTNLQYTLSNPGNTPINWTAGKIADWVSLSTTSGTLAAGADTTVSVSINGNATSLNAGLYNDIVTFTNITNASGDTTRSVALTVSPKAASVTLANLNQSYDGTPRPVSVTTDPPSLSYIVTYNSSSTTPKDAGNYAVLASVTDPNYTGSASGNVTIGKASQTITFAPLGNVLDNGAPFTLSAGSTSGLAVSYLSTNTGVVTVSGNTATIVAPGTTILTASQAGNGNYNAASDVQQTLTVVRANPLAVTGGPYNVYVNGTLSLNGSGSFPSDGQTINSYQWDLNNDNSFGDVSGATPAAISYSALISTWGMSVGYHTIQLKITDSAAKTSTISTTVLIINSFTWDSNNSVAGQTNGGGTWLGANQWWDGSANTSWVSGAAAIFGGPATAGGIVTLASPTTVNSITLNPSFTGTYTIGTADQTITLNSGIIKSASSKTAIIISPIMLGGNQSWTNNGVGLLTVGTGGIDNGGYALAVNGSANTTITSTIGGSGGLTKSGVGTLVLNPTTDASDYSGITTVSEGVLNIQKATALGSVGASTSVVPGAALEIQGGITVGAETLSLGGNGVSSDGALRNISGSNIYGGLVTLAGSTRIHSDSGTLTLSNTGTITGAGSSLTFGGAGNVTVNSNIGTTSGVLTKDGAGTLTLAGTNTYSGGTILNAGMVVISVDANLGSPSGAIIFNGSTKLNSTTSSTLNMVRSIQLNNSANATFGGTTGTSQAITTSAAATGNGGIIIAGSGSGASSLTLSSASNSFTGPIWIGPTVQKNIGGAGNFLAVNSLTDSVSAITFGYGNTAPGQKHDQAFIWSGPSALVLDNRYFEFGPTDTTATFGSGMIENANTDGSQTLTINTDLVVSGFSGSKYLTLRGVNIGNNTFAGKIGDGSGMQINLIKDGSGKWVLSSTNTFTGTTLISGGILQLGDGTLGKDGTLANTSSITNNATLIFNRYGNLSSAVDISGSGAVTKAGPGSQTLTGNYTYTGATTVSGGKLLINGSLSNVASGLTVASEASLGGSGTIGRNVTVAAGGKLEFDLSTTAANHDRLDISTGRSFGFSGTSELTITSSSGASPGTYILITGGNNITGSAPATVNLPAGWGATVSISGNSLLLNVTSTGGPGSVDHFTISSIASPQTVGNPINGIMITAQDATNATASDFTGTVAFGGTGGFTGTSAVFVSGVLSGVTVTPAFSGSNLTFTVDDGMSHTGSASIATIQSVYNGWSSNLGFNVDTNDDGIDNGMAWALGASDPSASANSLLPITDNTSDPTYLIYTYRRSGSANAAATIVTQFNTDLSSNWTTAVHDGTNIIIAVSDNFYGTSPRIDKVEVKIKRTLAIDGKLFMRLSVTVAP